MAQPRASLSLRSADHEWDVPEQRQQSHLNWIRHPRERRLGVLCASGGYSGWQKIAGFALYVVRWSVRVPMLARGLEFGSGACSQIACQALPCSLEIPELAAGVSHGVW